MKLGNENGQTNGLQYIHRAMFVCLQAKLENIRYKMLNQIILSSYVVFIL